MRAVDDILEDLSSIVRVDKKSELLRDGDLGFVLSRKRVREIEQIVKRMLELYTDEDIEEINKHFMMMIYPSLYAQKYGGNTER